MSDQIQKILANAVILCVIAFGLPTFFISGSLSYRQACFGVWFFLGLLTCICVAVSIVGWALTVIFS